MALAWTKFFPDGRGLINGRHLNDTFTGVRASLAQVIGTLTGTGATSFTGATTTTRTALNKITPQIVTAAGSTQLGATAITGSKAIVTVATTASTHGVRLPTAATGLEVTVANAASFGVKVYPATNGKIGAVATNGADTTVLAINKANRYIAVNTTLWVVERGA